MGQSNGRSVTFRAQWGKVNEKMYVSNLHGMDRVSGIDHTFVVWWSVERACKPNVDQILVVYKYVDVFPEDLSGLPPSCELDFMTELIPIPSQ